MNLIRKTITTAFLSLAIFLLYAPATSAQQLELQDAFGNVIRLQEPAKRIVSLPLPIASMLTAISGSADLLVGMHPAAMASIKEGMMGKMFPSMLKIDTTICGMSGWTPNVEEVVRLDPDLVFQWGTEGVDSIAPLKNAGLNVALVRYGTQEDLQFLIRLLGQASGHEDRAEALLSWMEDTKKVLAEKLSAIPADKKPRVLSLLRAKSSFAACGAGTYHALIIEMAGGVNVADELKGYPEVNEEQIISWNPDIILLNNFEGTGTAPEMIYQNKILAEVAAVQNRRVYRAPLGGFRWETPNQESPLMWTWLAKLFHPAVFTYDLREMMKERFRFLYGYELAEADIDDILWLNLNGSSAGYDVFALRN